MNNEPIYTVTSIGKPRKDGTFPHRTWGFFHEKELAKRACEANAGDLTECLYEHLLVQEIFPGGMGSGPLLSKMGEEYTTHAVWYDVLYGDDGTGDVRIIDGERPDFIQACDTFGFE